MKHEEHGGEYECKCDVKFNVGLFRHRWASGCSNSSK